MVVLLRCAAPVPGLQTQSLSVARTRTVAVAPLAAVRGPRPHAWHCWPCS